MARTVDASTWRGLDSAKACREGMRDEGLYSVGTVSRIDGHYHARGAAVAHQEQVRAEGSVCSGTTNQDV